MSLFRRAGNEALLINNDYVNNAHADITITTKGSDWYWTVTALMMLATLAFLGMGAMKPRSQRIFHYITAAVTMVASIAYFSMASNLGWTPITVEFERNLGAVSGVTREIFYVRYIDWFITTPLLLLDLLLTAGLPMPTILFTILVDEVMIITGLVGALVISDYKWGYFTFGCVALGWIVYVLVWEARRKSLLLGDDVGRAFLYCGSLTAFLWILYPIAWGVCEGGNVVSPDGEAGFYGALDVFAKPVFGALLLWGHRNIDPARLGLSTTEYGLDSAVYTGKAGTEGHSNGHHNGVTAEPATTTPAATQQTV